MHLGIDNVQRRPKTLARQLQFEVPDLEESTTLPQVERPELTIALESTARVLEFPRPTEAPVWSDELAEPVLDRPRIVEAPELLPPPPAMGGILNGSHGSVNEKAYDLRASTDPDFRRMPNGGQPRPYWTVGD